MLVWTDIGRVCERNEGDRWQKECAEEEQPYGKRPRREGEEDTEQGGGKRREDEERRDDSKERIGDREDKREDRKEKIENREEEKEERRMSPLPGVNSSPGFIVNLQTKQYS